MRSRGFAAASVIVLAAGAAAAERPGAFTEATASALGARLALIRASLESIVAAGPQFPAALFAALAGFAATQGGALGGGALLLAIAASLALAAAPVVIVRRATRRARTNASSP